MSSILQTIPGFKFLQDITQQGVSNQATTTGLGGNTLLAGANAAGLLERGAEVLEWLRMWQREEDADGLPVTRSYGVPTTDVAHYSYNRNGNPAGTYRVGVFDDHGRPVPA